MVPASDVVLLHHIVKDVGIGQDHAMVTPEVKKCIGTPQLDLSPHFIGALRIQPHDSQVLPAPTFFRLLHLSQLVTDELIRGVHGQQGPVFDQGRQVRGQAFAIAGHGNVDDYVGVAIFERLVCLHLVSHKAQTRRKPGREGSRNILNRYFQYLL